MKPIDWLIRHTVLPVILSLSFSTAGYSFFGSYYNKVKQAVKTGNISNLTYLLSNVSDSNIRALEKPLDEDGETFLTHAISLHGSDVAFNFIDANLLINHPNRKNLRPIEVAILNDKTEILERLISAGANIEANENMRSKVIHYIFKTNNRELISSLVNDRDLNVLDEHGNTPLMTALKNGHKKLVISKLSPKIDINHINDNQETLLGFALETHDHSFLELLISLNVDINQKARFSSLEGAPILPPLTYGIMVEDYNLVERLVECKNLDWSLSTETEETYVNTATRLGRNQILGLLVRRGANYRQPDKQGNTPLINACKQSNEKIAKKLIALGTDINFVNLDGRSAISYAIESNSESIVERLINAHADLNSENYLYYAIVNQSYKIAKMLLDVGAEPNLKANYPNFLAKLKEPETSTPLYHAIETEDVDIVKLLLGYDQTDLSIRHYNESHSYLNRAIYVGNSEIVKLLLKKEASIHDLEYPDAIGNTPLLTAAQKGVLETVKILLDMGADIEATNNKGMDAFKLTKSKQPKVYAFLNYYQAKLSGSLSDIEYYFNNSKTEQDLNDLFNLLLKKYNKFNGYLLSDHLISLIDSIESYDLLVYLKGLLKTYTRLDDSRNEYLTERLNKLMVSKWEDILDQMEEREYSAYANLEQQAYDSRCALTNKPVKAGRAYFGPTGCKKVVHKQYFHKYVEAYLADHRGEPLRFPGCDELVSTDLIKSLEMKPEVVAHLRLVQITNRLATHKGFRFCPPDNCLGGKTVTNAGDKFYSCPICDFEGNL